MQLPSKFTELLRAKGRSLREIGVSAIGLSRADAVAAIETLAGSSVAILSGDVLRVANDRPQYTYSNWRASRGIGEASASFIARSHAIARDYIENYAEPAGQLTLYTLVPSDFGECFDDFPLVEAVTLNTLLN